MITRHKPSGDTEGAGSVSVFEHDGKRISFLFSRIAPDQSQVQWHPSRGGLEQLHDAITEALETADRWAAERESEAVPA